MAQIGRLSIAAVTCIAAFIATASPQVQASQGARSRTARKAPVAQAKPAEPPPLACGDYLAFQVLLDKQNFSVGEIDGKPGPNFTHALAALQLARNLPSSGVADCDTWHALGGDTAGSPTVMYQMTEADANGPFVKAIPPALPDQAALPALGYTSPLESLAEKFHTSPAVLQRLNPGVRFDANQAITVPAVQAFAADAAKPVPDPALADVTVTVTRDESALRVTRADGTLVFFAPVTTGSEHDPLPIGDWKVTAVSWKPTFHYNPDLFWDAKESDAKATLKPGPNNPVGIVWVDVNIEHYGIHGTPEPSRVGHTESHGCVRLTNWDAARLASLVKAGTPVQFR
jgi:lipoprotein-anchoring transpeptidase ErfK/SrfK